MNTDPESRSVDAALRALFAPPADLAARAAAMVAPRPLPRAPVARWWIAAGLAAAGAFAAGWLLWPRTVVPAAPAAAPVGPTLPVLELSVAEVFADELAVFPLKPIEACSVAPVVSCLPAPGLPYHPRPDEVLIGPRLCRWLPGAQEYWSRDAEGIAVLLVLNQPPAVAVRLREPEAAVRQVQAGPQRVLIVARQPRDADARVGRVR
jgi:hypothetical protein